MQNKRAKSYRLSLIELFSNPIIQNNSQHTDLLVTILLNITKFANEQNKEEDLGTEIKLQNKILLDTQSVHSICEILAINNIESRTI